MASYPPQGSGKGINTTFYQSTNLGSISPTETRFIPITCTGLLQTGEIGLENEVGRSGKIVRISGDTAVNGLTGVLTATVRVSGSDSSTTIQWPAGVDDFREDTTETTFAATDYLTISLVAAAGSGTCNFWGISIEIEWD